MPTPEQALKDIGERITKVLNNPGIRMLPTMLQVDALILAYCDEAKEVDRLKQELNKIRADNLISYDNLARMIVGE